MDTILRLNAHTFPIIAPERVILDASGAKIIEIEGKTDEEIAEAGKDADVIMIVSAYLHGPVFDRLPKLRGVSRLGTGVDKIDLAAATKHGVVVANLPDFSTDEVADHTMALLLATARRLSYHERLARSGQRPVSVEGLHRLSAQTLGVVGLGRIGRAVVRRAKGFGMKILGYDPFANPETLRADGIEPVELETLLAQSDFIVLLCPLSDSTRGLLNRDRLALMKPTAVLVNTGRGELVDESTVCEFLNSGRLGAAAIDVYGGVNVFAEGGFPTTHPYFSAKNILLTPHVSANSEESLVGSRCGGAQNAIDLLRGYDPTNIVNPAVLEKVTLRRKPGES